MGLLDDAIREHLELKKRHGASADEVARLETEAFGPGRAPAPAEAPADVPATTPVAEEEDDLLPEEGLAGDAAFDAPRETEGGITEVEEVPAYDDDDDDDLSGDAAFDGPREVEGGQASAAARDAAFTDTQPWLEDDEDEAPAEPEFVAPDEGPEGEDVLEETPDFLQETPEHDRLWFEQKPPRDFDLGH